MLFPFLYLVVVILAVTFTSPVFATLATVVPLIYIVFVVTAMKLIEIINSEDEME